jgi:hypothetical protein
MWLITSSRKIAFAPIAARAATQRDHFEDIDRDLGGSGHLYGVTPADCDGDAEGATEPLELREADLVESMTENREGRDRANEGVPVTPASSGGVPVPPTIPVRPALPLRPTFAPGAHGVGLEEFD